MLRLARTNTVHLPVELRIPTDQPNVFATGSIQCQVKILAREEVKALQDGPIEDEEYLRKILVSVTGLGDSDGKAIEGDAALEEVFNGAFFAFLQPAIIGAYFDQFGRAHVKTQAVARALIGKGPRSDGADRNHEPAGAVSAADFLRDGAAARSCPASSPSWRRTGQSSSSLRAASLVGSRECTHRSTTALRRARSKLLPASWESTSASCLTSCHRWTC